MKTEDVLKKYSGVLLIAIFTVFTYLTGSQFTSLPKLGVIESWIAVFVVGSMMIVVVFLCRILFRFAYIFPGDIEKYRDIRHKYNNHLAYLRVMLNDYSQCIIQTAPTVHRHQLWFSRCFWFSMLNLIYVVLICIDAMSALYTLPVYAQACAIAVALIVAPVGILWHERRRFRQGNVQLQRTLDEINIPTRPS